MNAKLNNLVPETFTRRKFISTSSTAAIGAITFVHPLMVRGSVANSKIRIGIIGCGGRGTWIAKLFKNHGGFEVVAGADYFQDKVDAFGNQLGVPKDKLFTGLDGYKKLINSGVDAVAIESPPYFHPEQAAAAVDAGIHVYLAKPAAVDVPGSNSITESGQKATKRNLCFLIDFQTRANDYFIEALQRVHQGDIGEFAFGEASYHAGFPFTEQNKIVQSDPQNTEYQLRAWGISRELSGDIITEQNIHTLDVMSWIMNENPVSASGSCGHNVRNDIGNCSDHFALVYKYPNNVAVNFSSRQYESASAGGIKNRMFGSKGTLETEYGGQVRILGENARPTGSSGRAYPGGDTGPIYKEGAETNIDDFYTNINSGNVKNTTLLPGVTSNLVTILGRTAAYTNKEVIWEDLVQSEEKLMPNLKGLKS